MFYLSDTKTYKHHWIGVYKELSSLRISLNKSSSLFPRNLTARLCHHCDGSRSPKQSRQARLIFLWSHCCFSFIYSISHPFTSFLPSSFRRWTMLMLLLFHQSQNISCLGQIRLAIGQKSIEKGTLCPLPVFIHGLSIMCTSSGGNLVAATIIIAILQILHRAWFSHD